MAKRPRDLETECLERRRASTYAATTIERTANGSDEALGQLQCTLAKLGRSYRWTAVKCKTSFTNIGIELQAGKTRQRDICFEHNPQRGAKANFASDYGSMLCAYRSLSLCSLVDAGGSPGCNKMRCTDVGNVMWLTYFSIQPTNQLDTAEAWKCPPTMKLYCNSAGHGNRDTTTPPGPHREKPSQHRSLTAGMQMLVLLLIWISVLAS